MVDGCGGACRHLGTCAIAPRAVAATAGRPCGEDRVLAGRSLSHVYVTGTSRPDEPRPGP